MVSGGLMTHRWRMYRHAFYNRNSSDGWSEEEFEFGRIDFKTGYELKEAGVPGAGLEFVERTRREILSLMNLGSNSCAPIARQLNLKGMLNNVGGDWTDRTVKIFADRYIQKRLRF
jgi:hypothetical protein